jgi:hypothetical protein
MQYIEPFGRWTNFYKAEEDQHSPFFGRRYHPTKCHNTVYNYYIHPQWDEFGSPTLYMKLLYTDYKLGFCIIEFIGEWNDCIHNDSMFLKRDVVDCLSLKGITKYILIGENVLNFHGDTDDYYQEWFDDIEDGWIAAINFREHVVDEFKRARLDYYMMFGGRFAELPWRTLSPLQLYNTLDQMITKRLNP